MNDGQFGRRLRTARLARCITQKTVQSITRIPQNSLSVIESGNYLPKRESREALARAVRTDMQWLDTGKNLPDLEGIDLLNPCRQPKNEAAAIELLKISVKRDTYEVLFYYDETNDFFVFKLKSDVYWLLFPTDRSEKGVMELIAEFKKAGFKYIGSWPDVHAVVYDFDPKSGVRWELINQYDTEHLQSMFEPQDHEDYIEKLGLIRNVGKLIEDKRFRHKLRKLISEYRKAAQESDS